MKGLSSEQTMICRRCGSEKAKRETDLVSKKLICRLRTGRHSVLYMIAAHWQISLATPESFVGYFNRRESCLAESPS